MWEAFWSGALFLLASPLSMAALAGAVCATAWQARFPVLLLSTLAGAAVVPWAWEAGIALAAGAVIVVGAASALRWRLAVATASLLCALAGLAAGSAAQFYWGTPAEVIGGLAAMAVVVSMGWLLVRAMLRTFWRPDVVRLGLAIVGAWIATLGALMLLLRWL